MTSPLLGSRIIERASRVGISIEPPELERLERYYELLHRWNEKINLTGLRLAGYSDAALDRLLIEPLQAAVYVAGSPLTWFDLGTGGGSPAIPLKIVRPAARLTMIEAKARKAAFLRAAVRSLDLTETRVLTSRIEELKGKIESGSVSMVTVRAVKLSDSILDAIADLLGPNGYLLLFGGTEPGGLDRFALFPAIQSEQPRGPNGLKAFQKIG